MTITKQRGVPCPCHQAPRRCLKRLLDARSEEPSDLFPGGYLGAVPRSMRGDRTVNLDQMLVDILNHYSGITLLTVVEFIFFLEISELFEIDLVAKHCSNPTEAPNELVSFAGAVGDELQTGTEVFILFGEPFQE